MLNEQLQTEIIEEAKNFSFYNYVSAAHNGSAVFDDIESWPDSAQVAYYAIVNYMNGTGVCWPFPQTTLPMKWQEAEQRAERYEKALKEIKTKCVFPKTENEAGIAIYDILKLCSDSLTPKTNTNE